ncbi:MAG: CoA pyrophosphatase [Gammaproteobacteria bacterium]|nr:CoA pyrophosphatase [Gammaproteobacteria bacterium]MDE0442836.1 CoA pyrophosphatase [Gammaproteobacteria bacterium]
MLDLDRIRCRLATPRTDPPIPTDARQAAVAVILRDWAGSAEILFIKRAVKNGDPWSGHMAFPGGHKDPDDVDLLAAAIRETGEEIGLDISQATLIGSLPPARPMSVRRTMVVKPFVFEVDGDPPFAPNHEVADVVWTPLEPMYQGDNHAVDSPDGGAMQFNGFRLGGGHFVWGMTYRMVQTFFETIDPGYERRPEW